MNLFIHVGLHKTGTTLLQQNVFPYFDPKAIQYIGRPCGSRHFIEEICWSSSPKVLVSSETFIGRLIDVYDPNEDYLLRQLSGIERLASAFPAANILIGVRSHASWILSCYKHYLKYGGSRALHEFFRLDATGLMKPNEFLIYPKLQALDAGFKGRVWAYDLQTLVTNPVRVIRGLEHYLGARYKGSYDLVVVNEGVSNRQAEILRRTNRILTQAGAPTTKKPNLKLYSLIKKLVKGTSPPVAFPNTVAEDIRNHYHDDWEQTLKFVGQRTLD